MLDTAFPDWPSFTEDETEAVAAVLRSNRVNYWTGQEGRLFEREFAAWCGSRHAIALANGTVALDLALHGLGIGAANGGSANDEVIVTPRTFLASVSSVVNAGARPIFCDVDLDSGNMDPTDAEARITGRTRAILAVHLGGWPCDMDRINATADSSGAMVIEDCAQAHGAHYKGRMAGSLAPIAAWSFCQDKIMTTGGEGGMITCDDQALWRTMWSYKDHGKSWHAIYEKSHPPGFRWVHESFGTNWRLTEMQSAIGRVQLRRMAEWSEAREKNADRLKAACEPFAGQNGVLRVPRPNHRGTRHANYKFYAYVRPENLASGWSRDRIVEEINARGIPIYQGSCSEVYLEKAFDNSGLRPADRLPIARELGETSLMMLVHPTLRETDIAASAVAIGEVLSHASR